MVIQFGYITLFASAFPLASVLSIVCNLIEIRSDGFKLTYVTRKPLPRRTANIGTWARVCTFQAWLAILTNCLIFGFSSEQMGEWFPSLFRRVRTSFYNCGTPHKVKHSLNYVWANALLSGFQS